MEIQKTATELKTLPDAIQTKHVAHIEKSIENIDGKQAQCDLRLQGIDRGITVLLDRPCPN